MDADKAFNDTLSHCSDIECVVVLLTLENNKGSNKFSH